MSSGTWAFLQEYVIYEYMMYRVFEKSLRLRPIMIDGKIEGKERWLKVEDMDNIHGTVFPDIKRIKIKGDVKGYRPAEIKYLTSLFDYHKSKKHESKYEDFMSQNGFIIVLKHDYLPNNIFDRYLIDVYELDKIDFISFTRENFIRLLNRQIKVHEFSKTWLMIQSKNFYHSDGTIPAASDSGRWCPSDNLTGFELAVDDKVIFIKTRGASKQQVNNLWSTNQSIYGNWYLEELYIAKITYPIQSRYEYCQKNRIPQSSPLWYDETETGRQDRDLTKRNSQGIRWKRVFQFKQILKLSDLHININELNSHFPEFCKLIRDVFIQPVSREISSELYTSVIEYLTYEVNVRETEIQDNLIMRKRINHNVQNQARLKSKIV